MIKKIDYKPDVCPHCEQELTYVLGIDRGTVHIVKQIARFIGKKGINMVHPRKEMEGSYLTSNEVGNLTKPRSHGLIARVKGEPGNYLLTPKGAAFLKGQDIPKYAIRSKVEDRTIGYFEEDKCRVSVQDFSTFGDYWEGINYEVHEGRIIKDL